MMHTIINTIRRYFWAELVSTFGTLGCASVMAHSGLAEWQQALGNTLISVLSYYGVLLIGEIRPQLRHLPLAAALGVSVRNLAIEFGLAEVLDSVLLRPMLTWGALAWTDHPAMGFALGKVLADALFYAPAIVMRLVQSRSQSPSYPMDAANCAAHCAATYV
jgi:hypothetical protein